MRKIGPRQPIDPTRRAKRPSRKLFGALAWARRLAAQPPIAIEQIKKVSNGAELEAALEAEKAAFARVFASADATEGISAFIEKRPPRFHGG